MPKKMNKKSAKKQSTPKIVQLPDKPSDLILLALHDLEQVERQKKLYVINMDVFHEAADPDWVGLDPTKCSVCFAGSVMARTLKANPKENFQPEDFGVENGNKLVALDRFRTGDVVDGFEEMGIQTPFEIKWKDDVSYYETHPKQFKADMKRMAQELAKIGF